MAQNAARVRAFNGTDDASYAPREIAPLGGQSLRGPPLRGPLPTGGFAPPPPETPSIAVILRNRRIQLGYGLPDAATALRLRSSYLVALEAGRFDQLPGGAYSLGFLRSYAELLGLDGDAAVRLFKEEAVGRPAPAPVKLAPVKPATPPKSEAERRRPAATVLLGAVVLGVLAYGAWYLTATQDRNLFAAVDTPPSWAPVDPADTAPVVATPPAPAAATEGSVPAPPPPGASATAPAAPEPLPPLTAPPPIVKTADAARGMPVVVGDPLTDPELMQKLSSDPDALAALGQSARQRVEAAARAAEPAAKDSAASAAATQLQSPLATEGPGMLTVTAEGADSWLRIAGPDGDVLNRILAAGESWSAPATPGLVLVKTGNAGALKLSLDGHNLPPIGTRGEVVGNVPLDAAALRARTE